MPIRLTIYLSKLAVGHPLREGRKEGVSKKTDIAMRVFEF